MWCVELQFRMYEQLLEIKTVGIDSILVVCCNIADTAHVHAIRTARASTSRTSWLELCCADERPLLLPSRSSVHVYYVRVVWWSNALGAFVPKHKHVSANASTDRS